LEEGGYETKACNTGLDDGEYAHLVAGFFRCSVGAIRVEYRPNKVKEQWNRGACQSSEDPADIELELLFASSETDQLAERDLSRLVSVLAVVRNFCFNLAEEHFIISFLHVLN